MKRRVKSCRQAFFGASETKMGKMVIFCPFKTKITYLGYFNPISVTLNTNLVPYPIENQAMNTMVAFSDSQNDVIWRYDIIMM